MTELQLLGGNPHLEIEVLRPKHKIEVFTKSNLIFPILLTDDNFFIYKRCTHLSVVKEFQIGNQFDFLIRW